MPEWLIEAEDGKRRTWLGDVTEAQAEAIRQKLAGLGEWNCHVTKRSFTPAQRDDLALEVHTREWHEGGRVGPQPFLVDRSSM